MFHVKRSMDALGLMEAQAAAWGLRLCHDRRGHLQEYARLLASYDRANVIGTRDVDRIMMDHVLDSLSCFLHEPLFRAGRLADVGSGGGLPGIPIEIVRPGLSATLVESTGKKGRLDSEELAEGRGALEALGAEVGEIARVPMLPEVGEKERNLVILEKTRETPARYPRRAGIAAKRPLGVR